MGADTAEDDPRDRLLTAGNSDGSFWDDAVRGVGGRLPFLICVDGRPGSAATLEPVAMSNEGEGHGSDSDGAGRPDKMLAGLGRPLRVSEKELEDCMLLV